MQQVFLEYMINISFFASQSKAPNTPCSIEDWVYDHCAEMIFFAENLNYDSPTILNFFRYNGINMRVTNFTDEMWTIKWYWLHLEIPRALSRSLLAPLLYM